MRAPSGDHQNDGRPEHGIEDILEASCEIEANCALVKVKDVDQLIDEFESQQDEPGNPTRQRASQYEGGNEEYPKTQVNVQGILGDAKKIGELGFEGVVHCVLSHLIGV